MYISLLILYIVIKFIHCIIIFIIFIGNEGTVSVNRLKEHVVSRCK